MAEQITLTVEPTLLVKAQTRAAAENTTLDDLLLAWIKRYAAGASGVEQYAALMARLDHVAAGNRFSRDEMNRRR